MATTPSYNVYRIPLEAYLPICAKKSICGDSVKLAVSQMQPFTGKMGALSPLKTLLSKALQGGQFMCAVLSLYSSLKAGMPRA
jgi:hypothetical protein